MSSDAPAPAGGTPDPTGRFFTAVRSWGLVRGQDRWFAGVCGAVAARTGTDPAVVRGALAALTLVGGLGFLLYGVAWALLPDAAGRIEAQAAVRGDVSASAGGAVVLVAADLALSRGVLGIGSGWWTDGRGWPLLVTGAAAALTWWLLRERLVRRCGPSDTTPSASPAPPGARVDLRKPAVVPDDATRPLPATAVTAAPPAPPVLAPVVPALVPAPVGEPAAGHGSAAERRAAARVAAQRQAHDRAERARRSRRPGSPLLTAGTLGLALLLAGAVVVAGQLTPLPAGTATLALAVAVVVVGLGAVLAGLRGRRTALVGTGVPLALLAVASTLAPATTGWQWQVDSTWRPGTSASGEATTSAVGRLRVDPSALAGSDARVAATVVAGRLEVLVPQDATVLVQARTLAGAVRWQDSGEVAAVGGTSGGTSADTSGGVSWEGGLDVVRVLAVGPDAPAVAAATTVSGDDPAGWDVPAGTAVVQATTWGGEVRVGAAGSAVLEGE